MNQTQPYMDMHSSHLSSTQPYTSQGTPAEHIPHYTQYQQPPLLQPGPTTYAPSSHSYPQYGYSNGVTSPQTNNQPVTHPLTNQVPAQILPLPAMSTNAPNSHGYVPGAAGQAQSFVPHPFDTTGQIAPPGSKPRVTATLWEDEGSLCYQVEAKGVCVARREDNHMINGTKLLNVAGMTRGRRDGILKSEKIRHVVKIGPMHLKGVWIPFDRGLDFANKEKITEALYPLFVHDIGSLLYHPANNNRANSLVTGPERRRTEGTHPPRSSQGPQHPPLHHHHSMHNPAPPHISQSPSQALLSHPTAGRPSLDRANTFPTPPTSASSLVGITNPSNSYEWNGQSMTNNVQGSQALSIDTGLSNTRSMPTTPATTPPGANMQNMQTYQSQPGYDSTKPYYSSAPASQAPYAPHHPLPQQNISRYGQSVPANPYPSKNMEPPLGRSDPSAECDQVNKRTNQFPLSQGNGQVSNGATEGEAEHRGEPEYINDSNTTYNTNRSSYGYPASQPVGGPLQGEHSQIPSDMAAPSPHQNGTERVTARPPGPSQWTSNYPAPRPSNLYSVMSDTRNSAANGALGDSYPTSSSTPSTYSSSLNGSNKRSREDDDQDHCSRPQSRNDESAYDHKRRKTYLDQGVGPIANGAMNLQAVKTGIAPRRR